MSIGAVVVGLYPTSSAKECEYILGHCEAVLAFTEDDEQTRKLVSIRGALPTLREIIPFDWLEKLESDGRLAKHLRPDPVEEDDLATLIYTSGTTGPPKGCMLTHRNLVTAAIRVVEGMNQPGDVVLLFLPLAHSYGRLAHQAATHRGATVALVADVARVPEALAAVRPTVLPAVPRVYEKVHANTLGEIERAGGLRRRIGLWALGVGARASRARREGASVGGVLALQQRLADRLVFAKVRERLGGRLRVGVSGAAPLSTDVMEFFHALGVPVIEGYGLTETASSATVNEPGDFRIGTVGRPVEGAEVRLAEDGEILIRSDSVFAGYYKEPEATAAALTDDGWLRTGDVGEIDARGLPADHRPEEGPDHHGRRQEHRAAEPRERPQDVALRLAGARRRRPAAVRDGARDARRGRARLERPRPAGARAGARGRRQPRSDARRADQALRDPPPRLLSGGGRGDPDAEATPQGHPRALRGRDREAVRGRAQS